MAETGTAEPGSARLPAHTMRRIGVLLCADGVNEAALQFLVLCINRQQTAVQYEFLPSPPHDDLLALLASGAELDRGHVRAEAAAFCRRYRAYLAGEIDGYGLKEAPPDYFVAVTTARFTDHYYSLRQSGFSVLALGEWKHDGLRVSAPHRSDRRWLQRRGSVGPRSETL
jgi:hypothetical protein